MSAIRQLFGNTNCCRHSNQVGDVTTLKEDQGQVEVIKSETSKRCMVILRMLVMMALPVSAMVIVASRQLNVSLGTYNTLHDAKRAVSINFDIGDVIMSLQVERELSTMYLSSGRRNLGAQEDLYRLRTKTNVALRHLPSWPTRMIIGRKYVSSKTSLEYLIETHRLNCEEFPVSVDQNMKFYTEITKAFIKWGADEILKDFPGVTIVRQILAANALLQVTDCLGQQGALGGAYFTQCSLSQANAYTFFVLEGKISGMIAILALFETAMRDDIKRTLNSIEDTLMNIESHKNLYRSVLYNEECHNNSEVVKFASSREWFQNMSVYINTFSGVRERFNVRVKELVSVVSDDIHGEVVVYVVVMVVVVLVAVLVGVVYTVRILNMTTESHNTAQQLSGRYTTLLQESKNSENILYRFLPRTVADGLRENTYVPEYFEAVTVFFSDIAGFSGIVAVCAPKDVVAFVNVLYGLFDQCMARYIVYKVNTVGDEYLVVAGMPEHSGVNHAREVAMMALDMRRCVHECSIPNRPQETIMLRIGIHSGPVMATVLGEQKMRYALLGPTVSVARTMKETSVANKIHISDNTKRLIDPAHEFVIEKGNKVNVEARGDMETHWLIRQVTAN